MMAAGESHENVRHDNRISADSGGSDRLSAREIVSGLTDIALDRKQPATARVTAWTHLGRYLGMFGSPGRGRRASGTDTASPAPSTMSETERSQRLLSLIRIAFGGTAEGRPTRGRSAGRET